MQRLNIEEIRTKIDAKHSGSVEMVFFGGSGKAPSKFMCTGCKGLWWTSAQNVYGQGTGCKVCKSKTSGMKKRISFGEIERKIFDRHKGAVILSEYSGDVSSKSLFSCRDCARQWEAKAIEVYLQGTGCSVCKKREAGVRARLSETDVESLIKQKHGGAIALAVYGGSAMASSVFYCTVCGHRWSTTSQSVYVGTGCARCFRARPSKRLYSQDYINEKIADRGLKMISPYVSILAKSLFECKNGHQWRTTPDSVVRGTGCPQCCVIATDANVIYLWKMVDCYYNGDPVYKVGITSYRVGKKRIKHVAKKHNVGFDIIRMVNTPEARAVEAACLMFGESPEFDGDGSSEMRALSNADYGAVLNIIDRA